MEEAQQLQQGVSAGLGITVDSDNDVVLVIMVGVPTGETYGVAMMPEIARHFGRSIRDMSREADMLQDELDDLDPEEIQDRLAAIRRRYAAQATGPEHLS
jgi:hypothetical protein